MSSISTVAKADLDNQSIQGKNRERIRMVESWISRFRAVRGLMPGFPRTGAHLAEFQSAHLRCLVRHAYNHVAYYRYLFDKKGVRPEEIRGVADLNSLPMTQKSDLLDRPVRDRLSDNLQIQDLVCRRTNGSTGEPFMVYTTPFEDRLLSILHWRSLGQLGFRVTDHIIQVRIPPADLAPQPVRWLQRAGLFRVSVVDSRSFPEEVLDECLRLQPDVIVGLSGLMALVADLMTPSDRKRLSPRLVVAGGDTLTPGMKRRIRKGFCAPVFEAYGSHEFNLMASECEKTGELHVTAGGLILEVVQDGKQVETGETGEVVATALHSFAQPFIRYRIGDRAVMGELQCQCGSPFPTIRHIEGRKLDRILLPHKRYLSPDRIFDRIESVAEWVKQYQILQLGRESFCLKVVPRDDHCAVEVEALRNAVVEVLGAGVRLEIQVVPSVSVGPGGKQRLSHSLLSSNYGGEPRQVCE